MKFLKWCLVVVAVVVVPRCAPADHYVFFSGFTNQFNAFVETGGEVFHGAFSAGTQSMAFPDDYLSSVFSVFITDVAGNGYSFVGSFADWPDEGISVERAFCARNSGAAALPVLVQTSVLRGLLSSVLFLLGMFSAWVFMSVLFRWLR